MRNCDIFNITQYKKMMISMADLEIGVNNMQRVTPKKYLGIIYQKQYRLQTVGLMFLIQEDSNTNIIMPTLTYLACIMSILMQKKDTAQHHLQKMRGVSCKIHLLCNY